MRRSTSQYGTFRTCEGNPTMSAIGGKPDITVSRRDIGCALRHLVGCRFLPL